MQSSFIRNASFLVLINLIIKPVYILLIDRGVQNHLGPAEYGIFFALFNFSYLFLIINDFGIQSYSARYVAQNKSLVSSELNKFIGLKLWLGVLYLILLFIAAWLLDYDQSLYPMLAILAINHIGIGYIMYLRTNLTGLGRFKQDRILSIADRLLLIVVLGTLLLLPAWRPFLTLKVFILTQSFSILISIILGLFFLKDVFPWPINLPINWSHIKNTLVKTWPYAMTVFLMTLYTRLDGVMIERLLSNGAYETGIYASGYRLLDAANMVIFLIASILLPMFADTWSNKEKLMPIFESATRLIASICLPTALILYNYGDEFMQLLYAHADSYWSAVFKILILTFIPVGVIYLFSTYITASGKLRKMNRWFVLGIAANIVLNLLLIPKKASLGAAYATLITQAVVAILLIFESKQILGIMSKKLLFTIFVFALFCVILPFLFYRYVQLHFLWESFICLVLAFTISVLLGLFDYKTLLGTSRTGSNVN